MKFVLNYQVGRSQLRMFDRLRGRHAGVRLRMKARILNLGGLEAMTLAVPVDLSKQHLDLALPGHLSKFINSRNQKGRKAPVNFLVHNHHGQTFVWRLTSAE